MRSAIAHVLTCLLIALLPVYNRLASVDMNRTSKDNLFVIVCGLIGIMFNSPKRELPLKAWVTIAIAFLFLVINQHMVESINVMFHGFYLCAGIFFFVKFYECFEAKYFSWILNAVCIGSLIQALVIFLNGLGYSPEYAVMKLFHDDIQIIGEVAVEFGLSSGTFGSNNMSGGYLGISLIAFNRKNWRWALPIAIAALCSTGSSLGILTGLAGFVYYYKGNLIKKKWLYLLSIVSMLTVSFTGMNGMDSGRLVIWKELISKLSMKAWLIGNGVGWYADQKITYKGATVVQEHSGFLSIVTAFGLVGLITFLYFLYKYAIKDDKYRVFSSIVFAAFCNAYGHFSVQQSTMMIIILVVVAVCAAKEENNEFNLQW